MAGEIRTLDAIRVDEIERLTVYFVFDLSPAIFVKAANGSDTLVKVKPSLYDLLPENVKASGVMDDIKNALNAGDKMIVPHSITRDPGESDEALLLQAQELYSKWSVTKVAEERAKWRYFGRQFDG